MLPRRSFRSARAGTRHQSPKCQWRSALLSRWQLTKRRSGGRSKASWPSSRRCGRKRKRSPAYQTIFWCPNESLNCSQARSESSVADVLLIDQAAVKRFLPMKECIEAMEGVFRRIAEQRVLMPLRTVIPLPEGRGAFAAMPAVLQDPDGMGIKVISVYPANHGTQYDSHQGAV